MLESESIINKRNKKSRLLSVHWWIGGEQHKYHIHRYVCGT